MRIEILGSGGANTVPRPLCACDVCRQARSLGLPYSRTGPSVFVHGPDVLIDTPEEAKFQIERSRISNIQGALYSHWHPDHTAGRRLWESVNGDWRTWPPSQRVRRQTPVYLPGTVADDFRTWMGLWDHLMFMQEEQQTVEVRVVPDDAAIELGETTVTPIKLAESYVFAYLFETESRRALIVMDELNGWRPADLGRLDLAVLPIGIFGATRSRASAESTRSTRYSCRRRRTPRRSKSSPLSTCVEWSSHTSNTATETVTTTSFASVKGTAGSQPSTR
jgi:phosphoribosyl 1,2-cyclic phosphate phosphodiesterase